MGWKYTAYFVNNSDPGHTLSNQQLDKNLKITFAIPSKNIVEKKKQNDNCKVFRVTRHEVIALKFCRFWKIHAKVKKISENFSKN